MKLATRINSFKTKGEIQSTLDLLQKATSLDGLTHVDLNYPEHFNGVSISEVNTLLKKKKLKVNSVAIRYYSFYEFNHGALAHFDKKVRVLAVEETKKAIDLAQRLKADYITIWPGQDGFEVPFQIDYLQVWQSMAESISSIASYARSKNIKISLEYKPNEPRSNQLLFSASSTLEMIRSINDDSIGITIDFAHSLASSEKTSQMTALILNEKKLFGVHINDGYGSRDDGLPIGSVSLLKTLEFIYLLNKYSYTGAIYIDNDPLAEDPSKHFDVNRSMLQKMFEVVEKIDEAELAAVQAMHSAHAASSFIQKLLFK